MVNIRNAFKRQDSVAGAQDPSLDNSNNEKPPSFDSDSKNPYEEKESGLGFEQEVAADGQHKADYLHVAAKDIMANGKERPIEVSRFFCLHPISNFLLTFLHASHRLLKISPLDACPSKTTPT